MDAERVRALEVTAEEHERRLQAINGSIDRLGDEVAGQRDDFQAALLALAETRRQDREDFVAVKTRAGVYAGIGAFLATTVCSVVIGTIVVRSIPDEPAPPPAASKVAGAGRR